MGFWQVHWLILVECGLVLFALTFLGAAAKLKPQGFVGVARAFQYPCPPFMGLMAFLFLLVGSVGVLAGPLVPCATLSISGAKLIFIFLCFATFSGHFKPARNAESDERRTHHIRAVMLNISLMGGCIEIVGYNLPEMESIPFFEAYIQFWREAAWWVVLVGRAAVVVPFLKAAADVKIQGFIGMAKHFGLPCASIMGLGAFVTNIVGPACLLVGPCMSDPAVGAMMSIAGAKLLILFLLFASYLGHFKALSTSDEKGKQEHMQSLMKNVSIIGVCVLTIGYDLFGM